MSCFITALDHEALLLINGPDSLTFLQGQTTCDTRLVTAQQAVAGAYCNVQGRVICDFLLCQLDQDSFGLRMRRDIVDTSAQTFGKYIIFSKAELDTDDSQFALYGVCGEQAQQTLQAVFGAAPKHKLDCISGDGFIVVAVDDTGDRFEVYIHTDKASALQQQLLAAAQGTAVEQWLALEIAAGTGRIEAATTGEFIPQMLNYDITGAVNFNKGCYTGQEVVARMHYRGKPKRRLYRATLAASEAPVAGSAIYAAENNQAVGNIVNAVALGGETTLLAATTTALLEQPSSLMPDLDTPLLHWQSLPYDITSQ